MPLEMTGLDQLRTLLAGKFPPPPMAKTMNILLDEVAEGMSLFRGTPQAEHLNPMGGVHGGWYGALLDSAMGCAVQTTLAPGQIYTTLEYKVNITRALRPGVEVTCRGTVQHAGRSTAVSRAEILGAEDGRVYGTGSTTCLILAAR